ATCHPVIPAWFGRYFADASSGGWEAIISSKNQTEVWLPNSRDQACSVIGKFTQRSGKTLTRRLVTDQGGATT
ncbi:MAG: hypothetical protein AB2556_12880, partial [Candidatus Thiodiazotropha sp.]